MSELVEICGKQYIREKRVCPNCDGTKYVPTKSTEALEADLDKLPCHFCDEDGFIYSLIFVGNVCVQCDD